MGRTIPSFRIALGIEKAELRVEADYTINVPEEALTISVCSSSYFRTLSKESEKEAMKLTEG